MSSSNNTAELRPCPFCGGEASVEEMSTGLGTGGVSFSVGCGTEHCMGYQSLSLYARRGEAVEAWNRRWEPPRMKIEGVVVYSIGPVHCSVCAPRSMSAEEVAAAASALHPTGLDHGWRVDEAPTFSGGEPNPGPCDQDPERVHYLMVC